MPIIFISSFILLQFHNNIPPSDSKIDVKYIKIY